jgi:hypothetical protein
MSLLKKYGPIIAKAGGIAIGRHIPLSSAPEDHYVKIVLALSHRLDGFQEVIGDALLRQFAMRR